MFKVNNKDTIETLMASFWCFVVNFEHISHSNCNPNVIFD